MSQITIWVLLLVMLQTAANEQQSWVLVPELRIGSIDADSYDLSRINDLTIGPDGEIFVAQPEERSIRVFDAEGRFVRQIGRAGSGPGEFQSVIRIGWWDDALWVADHAQYRIARFDRGGRHLETLRIASPVMEGTGRPTPASGIFSDGTFFGMPVEGLATIESGEISALPFIRMERDGSVVNELGQRDFRGRGVRARVGPLVVNFAAPVAFNTLYALAPDGSTLTVVDRPEPSDGRGRISVARMTPEGDTLFVRGFGYDAQRMPAAAVDSILTYHTDGIAETFGVSVPEVRSALSESIAFPEYQPGVSAVLVAENGSIWLQAEEFRVESTRWRVLDENGRRVATASGPPGMVLHHVRGDRAWGVEHDELDVPYLVRYRIESRESSAPNSLLGGGRDDMGAHVMHRPTRTARP